VKLRRRRLRLGPPRRSISGSALRYQLEGMEPGDTGDCTPTTSSSQGAPMGSSLTTRFL
jgi:hypothetical protein